MFKKYKDQSIKFTKKYAKDSFYWLKNIASPKIHKVGEKVVEKITSDKDNNNWSNLKSSRKWNKTIIWALVSIAGFGITWSLFARIDETVQAIGKI